MQEPVLGVNIGVIMGTVFVAVMFATVITTVVTTAMRCSVEEVLISVIKQASHRLLNPVVF